MFGLSTGSGGLFVIYVLVYCALQSTMVGKLLEELEYITGGRQGNEENHLMFTRPSGVMEATFTVQFARQYAVDILS